MDEKRQSESTPGQAQPESESRFSQEQYDMLKRCSENDSATEWNERLRDPTDPQILLKGADLGRAYLGGADLEEADLEGADLEDAHLEEVNLREANLEGAYLRGADLQEADLLRASLQGADLGGARLQAVELKKASLQGANLSMAVLRRANLDGADLQEADLHEAHLGGANLGGANLQRVDLTRANLEGADLSETDLERADLLHCRGIVFDSTHILNTRHIPKNRWHELRNQYTGVRLIFTLVLLALFVATYAAKAMFWYGVGEGQNEAIERVHSLERYLEEQAKGEDPNSLTPEERQVRKYASMTIFWVFNKLKEGASQQVQERLRPRKVWHILIGFDKGGWFSITAILLITYNIMRYVLTRFVAPLSEEESRSHYTPALGQYKWLVRLSKVTWVLGFFALASFGIHCHDWLTTEVYVPNVKDANDLTEQNSSGSSPNLEEPATLPTSEGSAHGHTRPTHFPAGCSMDPLHARRTTCLEPSACSGLLNGHGCRGAIRRLSGLLTATIY